MAIRPSRLLPRPLSRLAALLAWRSRDRDMDQEMTFHVESLTREYVRSGLSEQEAERAARRRFGSQLRLKERGHDIRTALVVEDFVRDVRHMGRGLARSPGFAMAVVLTLALGIGGNTAIFSVVDQLLLRPLPYPKGDQLVMVYETFTASLESLKASAKTPKASASPANWLDWQSESRTILTFAAWASRTLTLTGVGDPTRVTVQLVSSEFFPLLGVTPLLGRTVSPQDDRPNAPVVAVLGYDLWQRRFAGDPTVIGRLVQLNDSPVEIVGVMPAGFRFVYPDNDLWSAYRLDRHRPWRETAGRFINVIARLGPGTSMTAAQAEMTGIAQRLAASYEFNKHTTVTLVPLREELTGQVYTSLLMLYAAVGVLLAIACFNVANLLLARAASRRREVAIRTSLGAGRLAIVRQLVVESLLLAAAGGVLGILLARWSLDALLAVAPADLLRAPDLTVDRRVLVYAVCVSVLTGLVVGLVPALLAAGRPAAASLRTGGPGATHSPRVRQILVVGQVAMTVILCGAGLLVRTMMALGRAATGFDGHGVLTMDVGLPPGRYKPERRVVFYREAAAALRALPGAESAAAANSLPLIGTPRAGTVFHRFGTPELPMMDREFAVIRVVSPGYFRTLRIPVVRGREFTEADEANPRPGFVVNEAFAKAYLSDVDPIGVMLSVWMEDENPHRPVIGVVGNVSEGSVRESPKPTVFYSHRQLSETNMTLFVRTSQPAALARPAVAALHDLDANLPITKVRPFEDALSESLARERLSALVSGGFALSGLLLASLGLYGLLAFLITERTRDIGIRIALGARLGRLIASVMGGGLRLVAIGAAIGVGGSLLGLRGLGTLLFGVTPYDPSTYAGVLGLLCAVAALASYLPARRAARVEPLVALRQE